MVRLVFRPYTQLRRSICTSESKRTSTRVSSGFVLTRHSSPSFGSQRVRSRCAASSSECDAPGMRLGHGLGKREATKDLPAVNTRLTFTFITPLGFLHPMTRVHVRLLGPCFKTGSLTALRQHLEDADPKTERPSFLGPARGIDPRHRGVSPAHRTRADQLSAHDSGRWATF